MQQSLNFNFDDVVNSIETGDKYQADALSLHVHCIHAKYAE